jgi:hypothetical protein
MDVKDGVKKEVTESYGTRTEVDFAPSRRSSTSHAQTEPKANDEPQLHSRLGSRMDQPSRIYAYS